MNRPAAEKLKGSVCRMKFVRRLAARNESVRSERPVVIACLGDSVTHGCFELVDLPDGRFETTYRPHEGYPARLQRRLNALYPAAAPCVHLYWFCRTNERNIDISSSAV